MTHLASSVRLLVSVIDVVEAKVALDHGADLIDVKDPLRGPLGMSDRKTIAAVMEHVRLHPGRPNVPVSAALGELFEGGRVVASPKLPAGLAYVKVGLAGAPSDWVGHLSSFLSGPGAVAVAYADAARVSAPPAYRVVDIAIHCRAAAVLIDTATKDGRALFDWMSMPQLRAIVASCRRAQMVVALAGSLAGADLDRALALDPDIVAVRGTACLRGDRGQRIDAGRVSALSQHIAARNASVDRRVG